MRRGFASPGASRAARRAVRARSPVDGVRAGNVSGATTPPIAAARARDVDGWVRAATTWLLLLVGVLTAEHVAALEHSLAGGQLARLPAAGAAATAVITFSGDAILGGAPDPRCPASSSVRLATAPASASETPLDCRKWRPAAAGGYHYTDPSAAAGAAEKIVLAGNRLAIRITGPVAGVESGAPPFVEAALTIGSDSYCGRFAAPRQRRGDRWVARGPTQPCRIPRPNFIVVVLDDVRADGVDRMPTLQRIAAEGVSFDNAFTPNASCAPSRASMLSGRYSLRHRTVQVGGPIGGAHRFRELGGDRQTIATRLHDAGYRTGLFGKYLNSYFRAEETKGPNSSFYIPPGWDRWWAIVSPEYYGGVLGGSYRSVEENGTVSAHADHSSDADYSTDLSAQHLRAFIDDAVQRGQPFFAYWAPSSGHSDVKGAPAPAQRHAAAFDRLSPWRPPAWKELDVADKPKWVQSIDSRAAASAQPNMRAAMTDENRKRQYQSLLSADEQLAALLDQLATLGIDQDTLILVTSDNGIGWGEHHLWVDKGCPYEECQRVPLVVRYPRRVDGGARHVSAAALNIDIAPTLIGLAGAALPSDLDGLDLEGWLHGPPPDAWRSDYLLEHWRLQRGDALTYAGQVADGDRLVVLVGETRPQPRRSLTFEFDAGDGAAPGAIVVPIGADAEQSFTALADALRQSIAGTRVTIDHKRKLITVGFPSGDEGKGVVFAEAVDRNRAFEPAYEMPDYLGVRDVVSGFTWVEYETGERELYDLNTDPDELENRADDPAYRPIRERLENRLTQLIDEIGSRARSPR